MRKFLCERVFSSSGCVPRSGITGSQANSMLNISPPIFVIVVKYT